MEVKVSQHIRLTLTLTSLLHMVYTFFNSAPANRVNPFHSYGSNSVFQNNILCISLIILKFRILY